MFSNLKLTVKLSIILTILVIAMGGVTYFGAHNMGLINAQLSQIVEGPAERDRLAGLIRQDLLGMSRAEKNMILAETQVEMDRFSDILDQERASFDEHLTELDELVGEQGQADLDALRDTVSQYFAINEQVRELTRQNTTVEATRLSQNEAREAFQSAYQTVQGLSQNLEEIVLDNTTGFVGESAQAAVLTQRVMRSLIEIQRAEKNLLLAETAQEVQEFTTALDNYRSELNTRTAELENLIGTRYGEVMATLERQIDAWLQIEQRVEALGAQRSNQRAFDLASNTGRPLMDEAESRLRDIAQRAEAAMDQEVVVAEQEFQTGLWSMITMSVVATLIAVGLGVFISISQVARPLKRIAATMSRISKGDLEVEVPYQGRTDEVGEMAEAVLVFQKNEIRTQEIEDQQEERERRAAAERRAAMVQMASSFEKTVGNVVNTVTSAATQLQSSSTQMANTATQTSSQATTVAAAAEEAATNVQTVASAAEQLSSSEAEISRHVHQSSDVAAQAAKEATQTKATVEDMVHEVGKIGTVVSLIQDIAEQTNLLALNATIEAARAGDAGKGFAVVASEVKNLANQTAKATDEISGQIGQVQSVTHSTAEAIHGIGETITEVDEIANSIAAAVEQQTAATQEIARNVSEASQGANEVTVNIHSVKQAAGETGAAASEINAASTDLSRQAEVLHEEVEDFLDKVRSENTEPKTLLEWSDDLATGDAMIDGEHQQFLEQLNSYFNIMRQGKGQEQVDEMLKTFKAHFIEHLGHEEDAMQRMSYPELGQHRASHQRFLKDLETLESRHNNGEDVAIETLNFMANWLQEHTMQYDKMFVEYLHQPKAAE